MRFRAKMKNPHEYCNECNLSHMPEDRLKTIKRMWPCATQDINRAYPCFYGRGPHIDPTGYQRLMRDLRKVRATA